VTTDGAVDPPCRLLGPEIRAGVERLLADAWGTGVHLAGAEALAERSHVVRVTSFDR